MIRALMGGLTIRILALHIRCEGFGYSLAVHPRDRTSRGAADINQAVPRSTAERGGFLRRREDGDRLDRVLPLSPRCLGTGASAVSSVRLLPAAI